MIPKSTRWSWVRPTTRRRCWRAGSRPCTPTPRPTSTSPRSTCPRSILRMPSSSTTVSFSGRPKLYKTSIHDGIWRSSNLCMYTMYHILFARIYIEKDGVRVEIGDGYSVGPGHGLIVSKIGDNIRVTPLLNSQKHTPLLDSFVIYIWNISWKWIHQSKQIDFWHI